MANIFEFKGYKPVIAESAFIHPNATVIGNVIIGEKVYIGPGAVIRGDMGEIVIEDGCNVQENCTIHMFPNVRTVLREMAHIGHGAIVHGGEIGKNCLIGMNAVIMDHAKIGEESIIGALALVPSKVEIPRRSLVVGNPGKVVKEVSDEMLKWKTEGTLLYQEFAKEYKETMKACEPLREVPKDRPALEIDYKTWKETKG